MLLTHPERLGFPSDKCLGVICPGSEVHENGRYDLTPHICYYTTPGFHNGGTGGYDSHIQVSAYSASATPPTPLAAVTGFMV